MTDIKNYFEVEIEYMTQAKLVMAGNDEAHVRTVIENELDIPGVKVLNVAEADPEVVEEAKARRAFEDAMIEAQKKGMN